MRLFSAIPPMLLLLTTFSGCISMKQFDALQSDFDSLERKNQMLTLASQDGEIDRRELSGRVNVLNKAQQQLAMDTALLGRHISRVEADIERLRELNDVLTSESSSKMAAINEENRALLEDLSRVRQELQTQEDALNDLSRSLEQRQSELAERSQRVQELEGLLASRDAAAEALRSQLAQALLGFADRGLSVEQRNGKVYVSLEAQLLFPSGSTRINPDGQQALRDLAAVISTQDQLEIIVEGHTDTDPLSSISIPKNNWELSVLRSTAVIDILTSAGVSPSALAASGRSEYHPLDETDKARNRRIEIIIAPNLDPLFDLIRLPE
ncbi:MAG: OmpA family protein [Flavobacteriales bacterium]|nr:OmpA family protein [Flavobacteriales bacterium]